jgi:hypothetical protein
VPHLWNCAEKLDSGSQGTLHQTRVTAWRPPRLASVRLTNFFDGLNLAISPLTATANSTRVDLGLNRPP